MVDDPSAGLVRARALHQNTREELVRADAKATTLLSALGIVIAAVIGGAIAGDWTPQDLSLVPEVLGWSALALVGAAEARLLLAVLPRVDHEEDPTQPRYFGHVVQLRDPAHLTEVLAKADSELDQLTDQVWVLSGIVNSKYTHVRRGLQLFAGGVITIVGAILLNHCCS